MKLKNCEYCGTEYSAEMPQCPLCGKASGHGAEPRSSAGGSRGGARVAPRGGKRVQKQQSPDRVPQWMWILICVILGLAVLIGLVYFLVSMGYVGDKDEAPAPSVSAPVEEDVEPQPDSSAISEPDLPQDLACTELELSNFSIILEEKGSAVYLTVKPWPEGCTEPVYFASHDDSIATVGSDGLITAVGRGQTEIIVSCGSVVEYCTIVCDFPEDEPVSEPDLPDEPTEETPEEEPDKEPEEEKPEEEHEEEERPAPTLSTEDFTLFRPGEEARISVKNAPDGAGISYVSSNSAIASVTADGVVTAVDTGTATITVTVDGVALTCIVRCNLGTTAENTGDDTEVPEDMVYALSHTDVTLFDYNESFTLSLADQGGYAVSGLYWSSSNAAVCTVDGSGRVTAVGQGTATISVTYNGQTYQCIVRCMP